MSVPGQLRPLKMFPEQEEWWQYGPTNRGRGAAEMSETQFDQKAWLERIGHSAPVTPTLETLNRLIFAHSHSISYETLSPLTVGPSNTHSYICTRVTG